MCVFRGAVSDGENIYVSAQCIAVCLQINDNKVEKRWVIDPVKQDIPFRATPCYSNGKVFFAGDFNWVICVDSTTGKTVWKRELPGGWGTINESAPVSYEGLLYVQTDEGLFALDCSDGSTKWKKKVSGYWKTSPIIVAEKNLVITGGGWGATEDDEHEGLKILDLNNGKIKTSIKVPFYFHTPILDGDYIYLLGQKQKGGNFERDPVAVCVDLEENTLKWTKPLKGKATNIAPLVGEKVVVFSTIKPSTIWFLDKDKGEVIREIKHQQVNYYHTLADSTGIILGKNLFTYLPMPSLINLATGDISKYSES